MGQGLERGGERGQVYLGKELALPVLITDDDDDDGNDDDNNDDYDDDDLFHTYYMLGTMVDNL